MQNGTYFNKFLEHFRNTRRLFKSIERWLFLEEKATYRSGKLILFSCYPTLATKTKTWRGWGTQRLLVFICRSNCIVPSVYTNSENALAVLHFVAGHHSGEHVVADVAMIEPDAGRVGHHVSGDHLRGCYGQDIGALTRNQHGVSVPMRRVRVVEVAERGYVPANAIAFLHGHQGHVAIDVSVDGPLDVGGRKARGGDGTGDSGCRGHAEFFTLDALGVGGVVADVVIQVPALVFVDGDIHVHKFVVHIFGPAVGKRHALPRDDEPAEQTGSYIAQFIAMRMVEPEDRAWIVWSGAGTLGNLPGVGMGGAGCNTAIRLIRTARVVVV